MNKTYKTILSVAAAAIVAGATLTPSLVNAWSDSDGGRKSYTIEQINKEDALGDIITFNSISDSIIGDEKNFVGARHSSVTEGVWNANEIKVEAGETYTVRLFVHNNSPKGKGAIAKGVTAWVDMPTNVGTNHVITGTISADNSSPKSVWDEVRFISSENVYLEYVKDSATYRNNKGTFKLPNELIVKSGAKLGYETMNGEIPGCFEFSGELTIQVKVHKSVPAKLTKQVRLAGTKEWGEVVDAKIGDEVEYQIEYVNLLDETVTDVMIRDVLPTNMEYVKDSTYLYNSNYTDWHKMMDDEITTSGVNIGDYTSKGNAYIKFTAKVVDKDLACGSNQLVNWASATVKSKVVKDDASVMVIDDGEECKEKPAPETPKTPETPAETPKEIVSTGAGSVVAGALGAGSAVTALGYYVASRKKLM